MKYIILLLILAACTSVDPNEAKEVLPKGATVLDESLEELVELAKEHYSNELYQIAISDFEKLILNFPGSAYQQFAELKIADAKFELGLFSEASIQYETYITSHPGSKDVEYASFRRALAAYLAAPSPGRNQSNTELALGIITNFIKTYPKSIYIQEAKQLRADCNQKLYEHELEIIRYLEGSSPEAYDARVKEVREKFKGLADF